MRLNITVIVETDIDDYNKVHVCEAMEHFIADELGAGTELIGFEMYEVFDVFGLVEAK